jgi:hypothetical protein
MKKAKYEEKFIVINIKKIMELALKEKKLPDYSQESMLLLRAIDCFCDSYKKHIGKELNQKYFVCNQDEPYAKKVLDIILQGENKKMIKG